MIASFGRSHWTIIREWFQDTSSKFGQVWSTNEGSDCFYALDVLLHLAGVPNELTSKWRWESTVRYFLHALYAFQTVIAFLQTKHVIERDNVFDLFVEVMKWTFFIVAYFKMFIMIRLGRSVAAVRKFIAGKEMQSGDAAFDELQRMKFKRSALFLLRILFVLMVMDAIFLSVPSGATAIVFFVPPEMKSAGPTATVIIHFFGISLMPFLILCKFSCNMATVGMLLMGMQANIKILANRYVKILDKSFDTEHHLEQLDREVRSAVDQQMEYWRHLHILRNLVEKTFFLVHYYAIFSIGGFYYITQNIGVNAFSALLMATTPIFLVEYYLWCNLVESIQNEAETIGDVMYELCAKMPYNREKHSAYVRLKSNKLILWINSCNIRAMKCLGLFDISTLAFVDLVNVSYSVLMFLINMS
ncbi:uncharacterized protein LOC109411416 isoform X1 [Aedes albopictus]|uniref:Odorant receptor n=1 Tax=Aedes albopictus TaxID=7160 RepID=A0ABM1YAP6_AEDAL|nr:uncharacterized protein LOC109411416 [Aedes albopictus]